MRWEEVFSAFADWRLQFLAGFVILTIVIAGILTFAEQRIRNKRRRAAISNAQNAFITAVRQVQHSGATLKEKLDYVDELAKNYFAETYGTPVHSDYSALLETFKEKEEKDIVAFCKLMFSAYYLRSASQRDQIDAMFDSFIKLYKRRRSQESNVRFAEEESLEKEPLKQEKPKKQKKQKQTKALKKPVINLFDLLPKRPASMQEEVLTEERTISTPRKSPQKEKGNWLGDVSTYLKKRAGDRAKKEQEAAAARKKEEKALKQNKIITLQPPQTNQIQPQTVENNTKETILPPSRVNQVSTKQPVEEPVQEEPRQTRTKDPLETERSQWLKDLKKGGQKKKVILRSTGTYDWLKDVRRELNIK